MKLIEEQKSNKGWWYRLTISIDNNGDGTILYEKSLSCMFSLHEVLMGKISLLEFSVNYENSNYVIDDGINDYKTFSQEFWKVKKIKYTYWERIKNYF